LERRENELNLRNIKNSPFSNKNSEVKNKAINYDDEEMWVAKYNIEKSIEGKKGLELIDYKVGQQHSNSLRNKYIQYKQIIKSHNEIKQQQLKMNRRSNSRYHLSSINMNITTKPNNIRQK